MKYIYRGFLRAERAVRHHPWQFLLLCVLQLLVLGAMLYTGMVYQLKILADAQNIILPLEQANYESEQLEEGQPFLPDAAQLYLSYRSLQRNLLTAIILLSMLFLLGQGVLWGLSHRLLQGLSWRSTLNAGLQYSGIALLLYSPLALLGYFSLRFIVMQQLATDSFSAALRIILVAFLVAYYVLLVAGALVPLPWKALPKQWLLLAVKKIHLTLAVLLLNAAIIAGLLSLLYLSLQPGRSSLLLFLSIVLLIAGMVFVRLSWIGCLREITHHAHEKSTA